MIRVTHLDVSRFENSDAIWSALVTLVEQGALALTPQVIPELDPRPYGFWARAVEGSPELGNVRAVLAALPGVQVREYVETVWEASDFATADVVRILGVDLDNPARSLWDEREFPAAPPCSGCGKLGFGRYSIQDPLHIDVAAAQRAPACTSSGLIPAPAGGWDIMAVPGNTIVSRRVLEVLREFRGWCASPVLDLSGSETGMARLYVARAHVQPITEHPGVVCSACGLVLGHIQEPWMFRGADIEGVDLFSQGEPGDSHWARRALVDELSAQGVTGLKVVRPARVDR